MPTHSPRCGRRLGLVRLVGDELTVTDIGSRLTCSRVSACFAAPTPDICHRQTRASGSFGHFHCALHLNPAEKVLAPAACGSTRMAIAEAHTAVSVAIGYRLAALRRHPIGFSLRLPNAQSSLFRNACAGPSGTLSTVNRLVLHSHSLQAQCSRCARGCRRREPTRSPLLCSSHVKRFTAL